MYISCVFHCECVVFVTIPIHCREFGARAVNVKHMLKAMPGMFEHSDRNVRTEVRTVEPTVECMGICNIHYTIIIYNMYSTFVYVCNMYSTVL